MSKSNGEAAPVAQEKVNTDIVTLTRFLTEEQTKHKEATGDFTCASHSPFHEHSLSDNANIHLQAYYAMLYNSPSNPLPTTSDELVSSISAVSPVHPTAQATIKRNLMSLAMTSL